MSCILIIEAKRKMGSRSKQKGKRGQKELAEYLTSNGWPARSCDPPEPDLVCEDLGFLHIECKRSEKFHSEKYFRQANEDAEGRGGVPTVMHRRNRGEWMLWMRLKDFLSYLSRREQGAYEEGREKGRTDAEC